MKELWERMERWLELQAPEVLADLQPGATESEIAELEAAIGCTLPADFKESLRIHNGQAGDAQWLIAGWELLSTKRIYDEWTVWKDLNDKGTFENWDVDSRSGIADVWWHPAWIPLTYNGAGDHHCLDLSPAEGGTSGQIITMWHDWEERSIIASSFRQWFEHLVYVFESNDAEYIFDGGDFEFDTVIASRD